MVVFFLFGGVGGISFLKAVACGHLALVKATFCGVCCRGHSPLYFSCPNKTKT